MLAKMKQKRLRKDPNFDRNVCAFCGEPSNEKKCGKFFTSKFGFSVHQYCMFFSAALPQNGKDEEGFEGFLERDVLKEIRRAARLKCCMCGKKGASAGCSSVHCRKGFHFFCGVDQNYLFQFFGQFRAYCVDHRPHQKTRPYPNRKAQCPICLESVQCHACPDILTTPCCKDIWFHRSCVQEQAAVSGYFFRCSVCNDKDKFVREMKRMGIYVPDRDAAWEEGDNFAELLEKYNRCDYILCNCPLGRKHSTDSGKWEMVLCASCGQFGTHVGCKNWSTNPPYLLCPTCLPIHEDSIPTTDAAASSLTSNPEVLVAKSSNNPKGGKQPRKKQQQVDSDTDSDDIATVLNGLKRQAQDDFLNSDTNFFVQRAIAAGTAAMSTGSPTKFKSSQSPIPFNRKRKAQDGDSDDEILITKYVPAQKCQLCPKCNRRKPSKTFCTVVKNSRSTCTKTKADVERKEDGYESEEFNRTCEKLNARLEERDVEARNVRVADYEVLELAAERTDKSSVLVLSSEKIVSRVDQNIVTEVGLERNCKNGSPAISSAWQGAVERLLRSLHTNSNPETINETSKNEAEDSSKELESSDLLINKDVSNGGSLGEKGQQNPEDDVDVEDVEFLEEQHVSLGGKLQTSGRQSKLYENTSETTSEGMSYETSKNVPEKPISFGKDANGKQSTTPRKELETKTEILESFGITSQSNSRQMFDCNLNMSTTFSSSLPTSGEGSSIRDLQFLTKKAVLEAVIDHTMEHKKSTKEPKQRCVSC